MEKQLSRRPVSFVKHYLNPFYILSENAVLHLKIIGQFFGIIFLTAIIAFVFISNVAPFGIATQYSMDKNSKNILQLGPKNRIQTLTLSGQQITKLTDDLVYFTTQMPFNFDSATVKVWYQNSSPNQTLSVGFQDQNIWHYAAKPFSVPFLDSSNWIRTGSDPTLYQRNKTYNSSSEFLKNPPKDAIIGTYGFDSFNGGLDDTKIASYTAQQKITEIPTVFRGSQTLYVYLDNEPLHFSFEKQDLNWYQGPDPVTVSIYKDNDLVYQITAPDNKENSQPRKASQSQKISVNNPGPGLPESGVYKIVINANGDTIIKNIRTNLQKIVFSGSIFLAGNKDAYHGIVASTSATTLYTNALSLSATTYHPDGEQQILVGNQTLDLTAMQIPQTITPQKNVTKVIVPNNDVVLNAFQGYFAFSPNQFFSPTSYYILPISNSEDVSLSDYILTDYMPSQEENGWSVNEQTFDLKTAYITNSQLSWVIEAPGLKKNSNTMLIKSIQVTFHKNALL